MYIKNFKKKMHIEKDQYMTELLEILFKIYKRVC